VKHKTILLTLAFLLGSITALAQTAPADVSGTYEAMVKRPGATTEEKVTLTLNFGKDAMFAGKVDGDKLVGDLMHGTEKVPVTLKKVTPAAAAPATPAAPAADAVNLNGQWDAVADANGQPFPFLLTLKIDGEKVSGNSSSQLGEATIKEGSWKDGKLVFSLEGSNGTIALSATVIEGKLSGEFDYAGQLQGKWVAVKKN
jgi:hypothetical protein